jgi:hypothetical protein
MLKVSSVWIHSADGARQRVDGVAESMVGGVDGVMMPF